MIKQALVVLALWIPVLAAAQQPTNRMLLRSFARGEKFTQKWNAKNGWIAP